MRSLEGQNELDCEQALDGLSAEPRSPEPPHGQSGPHALPPATECHLPFAESHRPWLAQYPVCVPKTLKYPAIPACGLLTHSACEFPDRIACIHLHRTTTYAELAEQRTARPHARSAWESGPAIA